MSVADEFQWSLANIAVLNDLGEDIRHALETKCVWQRVPPETVIVGVDQSIDVYFLVYGTARVVHAVNNEEYEGEEVVFAELQGGDTFGEIAAIDGHPRSAMVVSTSECGVAKLPGEEFRHAVQEHGDFAMAILKHFARIIRNLDQRVTHVSLRTPQQRVFHELLRLARPAEPGSKEYAVTEVPSHRDIASWSSTTRDVVAQSIANLARRGIVERKHTTLYVRDIEALRELAR